MVADLLLLERQKLAVKLIVVAGFVALGGLFWTSVVSRPSPISLVYRINGGRLELTISNDSLEDDYRDVDLKIAPGERHAYFGEMRQVSGPQTCYFVPNMPGPMGIGEDAIIWASPSPRPDHWEMRSSLLRIRCQYLPRSSHVTYAVQFLGGAGKGGTPNPVVPASAPSVDGRFSGKFKVVDVQAHFKLQE
jgi:hypothetical protein